MTFSPRTCYPLFFNQFSRFHVSFIRKYLLLLSNTCEPRQPNDGKPAPRGNPCQRNGVLLSFHVDKVHTSTQANAFVLCATRLLNCQSSIALSIVRYGRTSYLRSIGVPEVVSTQTYQGFHPIAFLAYYSPVQDLRRRIESLRDFGVGWTFVTY